MWSPTWHDLSSCSPDPVALMATPTCGEGGRAGVGGSHEIGRGVDIESRGPFPSPLELSIFSALHPLIQVVFADARPTSHTFRWQRAPCHMGQAISFWTREKGELPMCGGPRLQ